MLYRIWFIFSTTTDGLAAYPGSLSENTFWDSFLLGHTEDQDICTWQELDSLFFRQYSGDVIPHSTVVLDKGLLVVFKHHTSAVGTFKVQETLQFQLNRKGIDVQELVVVLVSDQALVGLYEDKEVVSEGETGVGPRSLAVSAFFLIVCSFNTILLSHQHANLHVRFNPAVLVWFILVVGEEVVFAFS